MSFDVKFIRPDQKQRKNFSNEVIYQGEEQQHVHDMHNLVFISGHFI